MSGAPRATAVRARTTGRGDWRSRIRRELSWIFVIKLAALALLWWVFFAAYRMRVDDRSISRQLGVAAATASAQSNLSNKEIRHD